MRRTNLDDVYFPVKKEALFLPGHSKPLKDFFAIVGEFEESQKIFSVVTKNYNLISNKVAFETTMDAFNKSFEKSNPDSFQVFNIIYPKSRSYVHIDVIHESFEINIYKKELYLPFFRITNSYNKTKRFSIDVGFVRELCSNGLIFEQDLISLSFVHTKNQLSKDRIISALSHESFKNYREEFTSRIKRISDYQIEKKYFIPIAAKALNLTFETKGKSERAIKRIKEQRAEFINEIIPLASKYFSEFGSTAYSIYNLLTDYSSNTPPKNQLRYHQINSNQIKAGKWLNTFQTEIQKKDFKIENYLKGFEEFLVYSFN